MSSNASDAPRLHPIIKTNYLPRLFAATFLLLICSFKPGWQAMLSEYVWLLFLALTYPHVVLWLALKSPLGKRQELINMHLDAFLAGLLVCIQPDYYSLTSATVVITANALYIGGPPLLMTMLPTYIAALLLGMGYFWPFNGFVEPSWPVKIVNSIFNLVYYSTFAVLSYHLTRRLITLNKEVRNLSVRDPLTGAYNRLYLDSNLCKEIHRGQRMHYPLTIIFADLDHFKRINDDYGHQVGDRILIEFVSIAKSCIRDQVDWIARFGGEEFVIVLPNAESRYGAQVAERIRTRVNQQTFEADGESVNVSCSFGVVSIADEDQSMKQDTPQTSAEGLIASADSGLYQAKAKGRNRVEAVSLTTASHSNKPQTTLEQEQPSTEAR